jgi:hypothetical protein
MNFFNNTDNFDYILIGLDPFILSIASNLKKMNKKFIIISQYNYDTYIYSDSWLNCCELFDNKKLKKMDYLNNKLSIFFKYIGKQIYNFFGIKSNFDDYQLFCNNDELFLFNFYKKNKLEFDVNDYDVKDEKILSYSLNYNYVKTNKNVYYSKKFIYSYSKYIYLKIRINNDLSKSPNSGMIYDKIKLFYLIINNDIIVYILDFDKKLNDCQLFTEVNLILKKKFKLDYLICNINICYPPNINLFFKNDKFHFYENSINAEKNIIDGKKLLLQIEPNAKNTVILKNPNLYDCLTYLFLLNVFSYLHSKIFKIF